MRTSHRRPRRRIRWRPRDTAVREHGAGEHDRGNRVGPAEPGDDPCRQRLRRAGVLHQLAEERAQQEQRKEPDEEAAHRRHEDLRAGRHQRRVAEQCREQRHDRRQEQHRQAGQDGGIRSPSASRTLAIAIVPEPAFGLEPAPRVPGTGRRRLDRIRPRAGRSECSARGKPESDVVRREHRHPHAANSSAIGGGRSRSSRVTPPNTRSRSSECRTAPTTRRSLSVEAQLDNKA